ncbi:hypothetical protein PKCEKB_PKCEKB_05645, partial [Dysosmobacter welbionis]
TQDDVLRQHGLVDAGDGLRHHRRRTGSQKHPHGVQGRHGLRRGLGVQLHGDAQLPGLQRQHVGDVLEVGLVGRQLGDVQRAAQGGLLLQQRHGEAPLGQDDGALQAAGAAAHDYHGAAVAVLLEVLPAVAVLPAQPGVQGALHRHGVAQQPLPAVHAADALTDALRLAGPGLVH